MNFKNYFDGEFCSSSLGVGKPGVKFFEIIISELSKQRIKPHKILFTDNEMVAVKNAESLGINGHVYTDFKLFNNFLFNAAALQRTLRGTISTNRMKKRTIVILGILAVLLVLSFLPLFTKSLMMGGEIQINFWQKTFMKID